ncbi:C40 family peptidase [Fictibacillus sp. CENA-BCM004]|uniref:C40 family peptidase n=2 Tax=Fictibacillus terranigra TaxID=3058424 RepID=A0ABT8EDX1_9BACL|nr:C40 family peptidase [Fictibacillus sp. CENA-BCM004]
MKRLVMALVSLGTAVGILLGGTHVANASPSYDQEVAATARNLIGSPFKWGGTTPKGFDASGYTQYVYKHSAVKMSLPRTSADQYKTGTAIKKENLKQGDLVFFKTDGKKVSFSGIYLGKNQFVGATSKGVRIQSLTTKYWKDAYAGAKRVLK